MTSPAGPRPARSIAYAGLAAVLIGTGGLMIAAVVQSRALRRATDDTVSILTDLLAYADTVAKAGLVPAALHTDNGSPESTMAGGVASDDDTPATPHP